MSSSIHTKLDPRHFLHYIGPERDQYFHDPECLEEWGSRYVCHKPVFMILYHDSLRSNPIVHVHGWVYEIERGLIRDLGISEGPPNDKHYQHKESTVNVGSGADILARAEADAKDV
ncbi:hypothetical protein FRC03_011144 [Tulasnella sp. 419]|nr:hypothetical protein FRC03_011144 [Tulasnella sp. 419]